jgi:glutaredoxin 3
MEAAQQKAQQLIDGNPVMVFSKSYCPYCNNAKRILDEQKAKYKAIELNQEDDGDTIQDALKKMTGQRTVPNIFIGGVHIGGNSDLEAVAANGKNGKTLEALLAEAGAL